LAVASEVALADPFELRAVTVTLSGKPTSAVTGLYAAAVAPVIPEHGEPDAAQRFQWYAYVIGSVPLHRPGAACSVCPTCGVPVTVGRERFTGGPVAASAPPANAAATARAAKTAAARRLAAGGRLRRSIGITFGSAPAVPTPPARAIRGWAA
jgi:hypothetical protein